MEIDCDDGIEGSGWIGGLWATGAKAIRRAS